MARPLKDPRIGTGKAAPPRHPARTPSSEVVEALVGAAERLLDREGPGSLTVRAIAAEAGVAPMGVYNHLGDKNGVVDELVKRGFDDLRTSFGEGDPDRPIEALVAAGHAYRRFALDHPARYSVMFDRAVPDYTPSEEAMSHAWASFAVLIDLVQAAAAAGLLVPGDPIEIAQRIWSAMHGHVSLELRGMGFVTDIDSHFENFATSVIRGLLAQP